MFFSMERDGERWRDWAFRERERERQTEKTGRVREIRKMKEIKKQLKTQVFFANVFFQ